MSDRMMRKQSFVLASTDHGTMITSRLDYRMVEGGGFGVGYQLLEAGNYDPHEVEVARAAVAILGQLSRDIVAIDCGANIGVHALELAKRMWNYGRVLAIEPQERVYYALCGNIALNNLFNCSAMHAAVTDEHGSTLMMGEPDYRQPASFGSLELRESDHMEDIGQEVDFSPQSKMAVRTVSIDGLKLPKVDFIKLDVEGMELDALRGARETLERCRPILLVEATKAPKDKIADLLDGYGYQRFQATHAMWLAVHKDTPAFLQVKRLPKCVP